MKALHVTCARQTLVPKLFISSKIVMYSPQQRSGPKDSDVPPLDCFMALVLEVGDLIYPTWVPSTNQNDEMKNIV